MDSKNNPIKHRYIQVNPAQIGEALLSFRGLQINANDAANCIVTNNKSTVFTMPLTVLAQSPGFQELWSDGSAVLIKSDEGKAELTVAQTSHHLMLSFQCADLPLAESVKEVYSTAYQFAHQQGFEHLIRVWNYIDQINRIEQGTERYQAFCVARHQVLEDLQQLETPNPAATAIGGHYGHNSFVFLFSHQPGQVVENKRQVSAWQYPRQYAPKQPRFSRAMQYGDLLLCSGTASVVGHETIHLDDLSAQFDECMVNIQALLDESDVDTPINEGVYRFYLRDQKLMDQVLAKLQALKINDFVLLEGDVCRENLLIECEAVFQSARKTVKLN